MVKELAKNHEVGVFTRSKGVVSEMLSEYIDDTPSGYDLAIVNHYTTLKTAREASDYVIHTCHGIIPVLEEPQAGADKYVAVSEEVKRKWNSDTIIRNPIDTELYSYAPSNITLKKILYMSNNSPEVLDIIKEACAGYELTILGRDNNKPALEYIKEADLVITLGRGCYEAMSCGKNVIVYDYNGADGFVDLKSIKEFRKNNCSGRRYAKKYTAEDLRNELLKYNPFIGEKLREYIIENNSVEKIAGQYLELAI